MKVSPLLCALIFATAVSSLAQEPPPKATPPKTEPGLASAYVTIPYAELRSLWEAAHKTQAAPEPETAPVSHIVGLAEYELRLAPVASALKGQFELEVLEAKWQPIALIGGAELRLEKAEAAAGSIVAQEGYKLLTKQAGKTTASLELLAPAVESLARGEPLKLELPAATVKRLRVAGIPAGMELRVNGRSAGRTADGTASAALPGEAGEVALELGAARAEQREEAPTPSHWTVRTQTLARPAESRLELQSRVILHADDGSGLEATLFLPAGASAVKVAGEDLAQSAQAKAEDGRRALQLAWKSRDILDRELTITYALPQSPLASEWKLGAPAGGEGDGVHFFAAVPAAGQELTGENVQANVPAVRLPVWMREALAGAAAVAAEGAPTLALKTEWLPTVQTAEATVTMATSQLRMVGDGSMQVDSTYKIRHDAPIQWQLELPADVQILACTIDGHAARPIQRAKGTIELSLPGGKESSVQIGYAAKAKPLDAVSGQLALELPRTGLFIERLEWSVFLPEVFELNAVQGNLSILPLENAAAGGTPTLRLRKDLCRGERPAVELYYQRRNAGA
jgi:hypothetical protein